MSSRLSILRTIIAALLALVMLLMPAASFAGENADTVGDPDNTEEVSAAADQAGPTGTIPVISFTFSDPDDVDKMNESSDHSYEATGVTMDITVPDGYSNPDCQYIDGIKDDKSAEVSGAALEYIRGRGNTTWMQDKKPYKFKLDKKASLFGMGDSKHWVLIANDSLFDHSQAKNRMVMWLGHRLGLEFTPKCVPVELVMNGEYYGTYMLSQQVRLGKNSLVNLPELGEGDTDDVSITGGYLIAMTFDDYVENAFQTEQGMEFTNENPAYEEKENPEATDPGDGEGGETGNPNGADEPDSGDMAVLDPGMQAQFNYIREYIQDVENAIYADDHINDKGQALSDLLDMDSAIDYWWLQVFTMNPDAFNTPSTYLYKKRDKTDSAGNVTEPGKLYWGPLWDFDQSLSDDDFSPEGFNTRPVLWFEQLRQDPAFARALKKRWIDIDEELELVTKKGGMLDQYAAEMGDAWAANYEKWNIQDNYPEKPDTIEGTMNWLRERVEQRRAWVSSNLNKISKVCCTYTFSAEGEDDSILSLYYGSSAGAEPPEGYDTADMHFTGWATEDGVEYDPDMIVTEDLHFYAQYIPFSETTKATSVFINGPSEVRIPAEYWLSIPCSVGPEDAQDKRVEWSSSDESVAVTDSGDSESCTINYVGPGHTVIKARLVGSGAETSIDLYIADPDDPDQPQPPDNVIFDKTLTVEQGSCARIGIRTEPSPSRFNFNTNYEYTCDDCDVISISNGVITGLSPGTATVSIDKITEDTLEHIGECKITVVRPSGSVDITGKTVRLSAANYTYNGKVQRPEVVSVGGMTLKNGTDCTIKWSNDSPKDAGTYTVTVTGKGIYKGSANASFSIAKASSPFKAKARRVKTKYRKLRKKALTIKRAKAIKLTSAMGKVTYKKVSVSKVRKTRSGKKAVKAGKKTAGKFRINAKTGRITLKKGIKKGTYKLKVKVKDAGNNNYNMQTQTITITVKVQ